MRHVPRKRFGQHFLVDPSIVSAIISAIAPRREDNMVEIGPGLGALTRPLVECLDRLLVVEIDRDIAARLRTAYPPGRLAVHEGDALEFDFASLGPALRVVGNLPYYISTPLLFRLAARAGNVRDLHVMLQREVVERMVAAPSSSAYGRLSVMLQYRFAMQPVLDVAPEAFEPAPRVHSALVRMIPYAPLPHPAVDERALGHIVTAAFSQRRKTLRNALGRDFTAAELERLGVDPGMRPQDLDVGQSVRLADQAARRER